MNEVKEAMDALRKHMKDKSVLRSAKYECFKAKR